MALRAYSSQTLGAENENALFVCQFNRQKVSRHTLLPNGASFETRDTDFVVSNQRDFHPTDVLEDADGSLLIVDTGGWYKICCPTSQLYKQDVLGAIYRVNGLAPRRLMTPEGSRSGGRARRRKAGPIAFGRAIRGPRAGDGRDRGTRRRERCLGISRVSLSRSGA